MPEITGEVWEEIPGYSGSYLVSSLGRVRSLSRGIIVANGTRRIQGRVMTPARSSNGYFTVRLSSGGIGKTFMVHRLVALAFVSNKDLLECTEVNHIDGDKENNCKGNLEWLTPSDNQLHAYLTGLQEPQKGAESKMAKLYEITTPLGEVHMIHGIESYCRTEGIDRKSLYRSNLSGKPTAKGYLCREVVEEAYD